MFQKNTTFGIYLISLRVLLKNRKYLYFILFTLFYPPIVIINRIFLFLDFILVPQFEKAKVEKPIFIMGVNRSGTTFFHKMLSKSNKFSTSTTWDLILPSISLRKFFSFFYNLLSYLKIDKIEKKNKGHEVKLSNVEEDEMLLFIHKLDSLWVTNHLVPWLKFDSLTKELSKTLYIDSERNNIRNMRSMLFCKDFFRRQSYLNKGKPHLSKSNPFIFKLDTILKVFPDAKFVFLVRDPIEVIPSYFSLQKNVKFGNLLSENESNEYRKESYKEIIRWYKETEIAKGKLNKNQYMTLTYPEIKNDLKKSIYKFFKFSNIKISKKYEKEIDSFINEKYQKKHHNNSIEDFGFSKNEIVKDFDFVYQEYSL